MAQKIEKKGGKILKNCLVTKIVVSHKKVVSLEIENQGKIQKMDVDCLISSMPLKNLINCIENENIPSEIVRIANGLPYREFMSVAMLVQKINLKNTTKIKTLGNVIPDSWLYIQEPEVKMGRMQIFNNWSPYIFKKKEDMKDKVLLSLEYFCQEDDAFWDMSEEEFTQFAICDAQKINLLEKKDVLWAKQIKIKKAYPAYFGTYHEMDHLVKFLDGYENLYCVGRNGQHRYNNMDHSMLTGLLAAQHIMANRTDKKEIWDVNTEKEYHEKK